MQDHYSTMFVFEIHKDTEKMLSIATFIVRTATCNRTTVTPGKLLKKQYSTYCSFKPPTAVIN